MSDRKPYDHQRRAWDALSAHFNTPGKASLLVVPTGGGKTFISAHWLLEHHVRAGGRVLWLTHRRSLLLQAMEEVERLRNVVSPRGQLGLLRISSKDSSWSRVDQSVDVVFSSLQTAIRPENQGFIEHFFEQSPHGVFVVVDEAHHAAATSYARLLHKLRTDGASLLGLTATPVRVDADDERRLHALFDNHLAFQIVRRELTERGFLAAPVFETVKTDVSFERDFTEADFVHLRRFGELGPQVLERVASHSQRNALIAKHYVDHQHLYGTTIVFAADTLHARTLAMEFQRQGVDADFVDYTRTDAAEVMQSYRTQKRPRVLINVEMLTEGFDAPHTQTVFIARPTRSEGLLMQMVGRALRGPAAGGNERAYLVTFLDTWSEFDVLDASYVLGDAELELDDRAKRPPSDVGYIPIPPDLVTEAYRLLQSVTKGMLVGVHQCLPHGWYAWEQLYEDDMQRRVIMVFDNQVPGYETLLAEFADPASIPDDVTEDLARSFMRIHFGDLPDPLPRWRDVAELLAARRAQAGVVYYSFDDKKHFNPRTIAERCKAQDLRSSEVETLLTNLWAEDSVCRHVYRNDFHTLRDEVHRELMRLYEPPRPPSPPALVDLVPTSAPRAWPMGQTGYSLVEIKDAVASNSRNFPRGLTAPSTVSWSKRPMKSWWGICRYPTTQGGSAEIRISCALNSPDIPLFVLEFLMHHELLHAEMPHSGHGPDFRQREHAFAPSEKAIRDATERGLVAGRSLDTWRVLGDQFFDTFDRYFLMKDPSGQPRY
ncbi:MAG: DEAD/DEAH box helicase family protein [Sandaracinaceae bacterium]|nr:DEAD/DEAH box helicase family protein [Sandaracinaceae bacterium]